MTKRSLPLEQRDSNPKATTEKDTVSLLGEGHLLGLGTASNAALASGEAALWYRGRDDSVGMMAAMKSESLVV